MSECKRVLCKRWECAKGGGVQKVGVCKRLECAKGGAVQKMVLCKRCECAKNGVQRMVCEKRE